jgi:hypothetical protein
LWFRAAAGTGYVETAREEAMIEWSPGRDGQWFEGAARGRSGFSHGADATTLLVADLVPSLSLGPEWDPWASRIWLSTTNRNGRRSAAVADLAVGGQAGLDAGGV